MPPAAYPFATRREPPLLRRILAFLIDSILIVFAGYVLGYIFFDLLMGLGPAGRLVGYFVGLFYFVIPESSFGNGQSLGKRLFRVQVIGADGAALSIERSCIRYTVFALPWFLYGLAFPIPPTRWTVFLILSLAVFGLGGAGLYLMLFNRKTRQGVHDLAVGGLVIETGTVGPVPCRPVWKPHWVFAGLILVLFTAAGVLVPKYLRRPTFGQFTEDIRQIEKLPGVHSASIRRLNSSNHGAAKVANLQVEVRCTVATTDEQALANQIADSLITVDPGIEEYGTLQIVLIRGYDIGIAHSFFSQTYSDSPAGWKRQFFRVPPQLPAP